MMGMRTHMLRVDVRGRHGMLVLLLLCAAAAWSCADADPAFSWRWRREPLAPAPSVVSRNHPELVSIDDGGTGVTTATTMSFQVLQVC